MYDGLADEAKLSNGTKAWGEERRQFRTYQACVQIELDLVALSPNESIAS